MSPSFGQEPAEIPAVDYARQVEPLLRRRCGECHGRSDPAGGLNLFSRRSLIRGGDSGEPAVVPAGPDRSFLLKVIRGEVPDVAMPPEGPRLAASEVELLSRWVAGGATMPAAEDTVDERLKHWAFAPMTRPAVPLAEGPSRRPGEGSPASNPIDAFIGRSLADHGLSPSAPAEREVLIRRLYFVLHGLPPSPEEVRRFLADRDPQAWPRLVDRVLASPRYGERWARYWLDLVRFGETHGFETNRERPNAWHYRDWVIESLNADLPYNQFVMAQLAGDATGDPRGTGFLVAGPHDLVKSPDINLTLMQRQDELSDLINATGTAFLGLTLGCARCHNHKFDPVTQADFYSLQAVFAGVQHADRPLPTSGEQADELARVIAHQATLERLLLEFVPTAGDGVTLVDDRSQSKGEVRGLEPLADVAGRGENPPGQERGFADDPGSGEHGPNLSGGGYTWWQQQSGRDVAAYRLLATGRYHIWVSWGAGHASHSQDAQFILDLDGDRATLDDQVPLATVDQRRFADGTGEPAGKPLWSGFLDCGEHQLRGESVVLVRGGRLGSAITADVLALEKVSETVSQNAPEALAGNASASRSGEGQVVRRWPRLRPAVSPRHNVERIEPVLASQVRFIVEATNSSQPCLDELEIFSEGRNVALASGGARASSSSSLPGYEIHKLEHIHDGKYGNSHSWISNEPGGGWVQIDLPRPTRIERIEWGRDREGQYSDRLATRYRIEVRDGEGPWRTVASSSDRLSGPMAEGPVYQFDDAPPQRRRQGQQWLAELRQLQARRRELETQPVAYLGTFQQPGPTHRLYRGDPLAPREVVPPDTVSSLGGLELGLDSPEQQRRLALARWITGPDNPLTARVIVNRLWQHHFGTGLVPTPSDFGANGVPPSHPQLLDWLASELIASGWSLKHVQRAILMSATWQQTSQPREAAIQVDAATRLLWRFPPRRLEAEAIRDSILACTGVLDLKHGGRGFSGFQVELENVRHYFPKETYTAADWRRMVYMTKVRQEQESVFGAFDCPDASQVVDRRSRSTTPLQALNLFNSSFVLQQAELLAQRLRREAGDDADDQVRLAFRVSYGREAGPEELSECQAFIARQGLPAFCRAVFNSNEFLFIP